MDVERDGPDPHTPVVTVVGEATLRAEPDEAIVRVTLSALQAGPGPALEDVARRSEALATLLDELTVAAADRSTSGVTVGEEFDHTKEGRRSLGHRAAASVVVRLTAHETIGRLITRATTELDAQVDGPRWQLAADNPVHLAVAHAASADGRRRAEAYAAGVGARLGALVDLREPGASMPQRGRIVAASGRRSSGGHHDLAIDAGEQEVTTAIEVTYELVAGSH